MTGDTSAVIVVSGAGRDLVAGGEVSQIQFELRPADFTVSRSGAPPIVAGYRDVTTLAVDHGRVLLVLGNGAARLLVEALGDRLGTVISELRERRARQMLHDRFVEILDAERLELVEYRIGEEHGVAQIAYHEWGVALLPVDERDAWRLVRRADLAQVDADAARGVVAFHERPRLGSPSGPAIELLGLGQDSERHRARIAALRDGALEDAAAIVGRLMPDAPFAARQQASAALVDGRPVAQSDLADAWPFVERAVLVDPMYASTYQALIARGSAGAQGATWIALAPLKPTVAGAAREAAPGGLDHMSWFLVGLPGNLLAFELVSEGSHATYLFRIVPRAQYAGQGPGDLADQLRAAVFDVSQCLIDTRFLREPIYLTEQALADPRYTRYRFAIAAMPTLQAARARFVGRLIHSEDASWTAALEDAIKWHSQSRDDSAVWPGGAPLDAGDADAQSQETN
jgi:hypothetical protein